MESLCSSNELTIEDCLANCMPEILALSASFWNLQFNHPRNSIGLHYDVDILGVSTLGPYGRELC